MFNVQYSILHSPFSISDVHVSDGKGGGGGGNRTRVLRRLGGTSPSAAGERVSGSPTPPASKGSPSQLRCPDRPTDETFTVSPTR